MTAQHTPTPWDEQCGIVSGNGSMVATFGTEEDAALCVRAVNAHDALVEALRECEDYFDQRADADCVGDPPAYAGNREMTLLGVVRRALEGGQS